MLSAGQVRKNRRNKSNDNNGILEGALFMKSKQQIKTLLILKCEWARLCFYFFGKAQVNESQAASLP